MTFFPLLKHTTWVTKLATHVAAVMTLEVTFNIVAPPKNKVIHNEFIWKMKAAHTPKILYSNQNVESLYLVEPESSTAAKGARQNTLDINIAGLKMRHKSIFKYIYGLSFPSLMWKVLECTRIRRSARSVLTAQEPLQSQNKLSRIHVHYL
jgi:hypothetical protein